MPHYICTFATVTSHRVGPDEPSYLHVCTEAWLNKSVINVWWDMTDAGMDDGGDEASVKMLLLP